MREDSQELSDELNLEYWFEQESRPYKIGRGRSGVQINAKECPACGDERWRTYLNADTGIGNCFVCEARFNKLKFIHLAMGHDPDSRADWAETFKHVKATLKDQGWRPKKTVTAAVEMDAVKLPRSLALPTEDGQNLSYLENRGIDAAMTAYFHLRYCVRGTHEFVKDDGTPGAQRFDERCIIPVFDLDGTLMTFQGRDLTGTSDRKYLFPKGLPGTGRFLLNGQNAVRAKRVVMNEGVFDVIATKIALDSKVDTRDVVPVGSFGKSLGYGDMNGNDQLHRFIELRKAGLEEVTVMWDGEKKALESALHAAETLVPIGVKVRIATLPFDKDPNEVPADTVLKAFHTAMPYTKSLAVKWRLRNPYG